MKHQPTQSGFAMLYSVLLVSLMLTIAVSISSLTLKQTILSNLAKDSGIAFYQADAAVECGLYQESVLGHFPLNATVNTGAATDVPAGFTCGDVTVELNTATVASNYFEYTMATLGSSCFSVVFDKTNAEVGGGYSRSVGTGYSICTESPRRGERSLEVKF